MIVDEALARLDAISESWWSVWDEQCTTPSAFQIYDSVYTDDDRLVCKLRDVDAGKRHPFHCSSEAWSVDDLQTASHEGKWTQQELYYHFQDVIV